MSKRIEDGPLDLITCRILVTFNKNGFGEVVGLGVCLIRSDFKQDKSRNWS